MTLRPSFAMDTEDASSGLAVGLCDLPDEVLAKVLSFCDRSDVDSLSVINHRFGIIAKTFNVGLRQKPKLDFLPSEILLAIFAFLDKRSLGRVAQVSHRFRALAYADCLWLRSARASLCSGEAAGERSVRPLNGRDRVRVARNWSNGVYAETNLLVQNTRFMPRLQLEGGLLWVSWGNRIWAHPRSKNDGTIHRTTTRTLKGHSDDVSRFVVKDGLLLSGSRDANLIGWDAGSGEFLFAKRYCHRGDISAIDVVRDVVVTGSRDTTVKVWSLNGFVGENNNPASASSLPALSSTVNLGDRVWSVAVDPCQEKVVVGSAGLGGIPALHMLSLSSSTLQPMGRDMLRKGAAVLELQWITPETFLSCGHDTFTRLWDARIGQCVRAWEEPFDEAVYCFSTDGATTLVCGTARHGLVRLWDMRQTAPVNMFYASHARAGQSSPVYSVAFDRANLYVALDQCLNLLSFDEVRLPRKRQNGRHRSRRARRN